MTADDRARVIGEMVDELMTLGLTRAAAEAQAREQLVHELDVVTVVPPPPRPRRPSSRPTV